MRAVHAALLGDAPRCNCAAAHAALGRRSAAGRRRILEQGAAERRKRLGASSDADGSEDGDDRGTQLDELHLAMIRGLNGRPPAEVRARAGYRGWLLPAWLLPGCRPAACCATARQPSALPRRRRARCLSQLLARAEPGVTDELFADAERGVLWLSDDEAEGLPDPATAHRLATGWRGAFCRPLLRHLLAERRMSLDEVRPALWGGAAPWLRARQLRARPEEPPPWTTPPAGDDAGRAARADAALGPRAPPDRGEPAGARLLQPAAAGEASCGARRARGARRRYELTRVSS